MGESLVKFLHLFVIVIFDNNLRKKKNRFTKQILLDNFSH